MMQPNQESSHYRNGNSGPATNTNGTGTLVPAQHAMTEFDANANPVAPAGGGDGGAQIEPKALLNAFRRRWFMAVTVGLLCGTLAATTVYLLVPPNYVAESTIEIQSTPPQLLTSVQSGYQNFETFKKTQMYKAISRLVLDTALNEQVNNEHLKKQGYKSIDDLPLLRSQLDLTKIDWLLSKLSVRSVQEEFFQIRMEHSDDPAQLAEIVNAITHVYLRDIAEEDKVELRKRIASLESLIQDKEDEVKAKRTQIKRLAERLGAGSIETLSDKDRIMMQHIAALEQQYMKYRFELENLKLYHQGITNAEKGATEDETANTEMLEDQLIDQYVDSQPEVLELIVKLDDQEEHLRRLEETLANPQDRELVTKRKKFEEQKQSLAELRAKLRPRVKDQMQKALDESQALGKLPIAEQIRNLEGIVAEYQKRLEAEGSSHRTIRVDSFELESLISEKDRLITEVDQVKDRVAKLKIELDAPERIELHVKAQVPRIKDMATLYKKSAMAGLGVFGLLVAAIVWFEYQAKRIDSLSDVTSGLSLRIMGALPQMPRWASQKSKKGKNAKSAFWHSVLTESIDAARTVLIRDANVESTRLVMVASAISGEGKTTLSSHLAASLARVGRNTILIDCDFRKANIHKVFGVEPRPGLSEVLLGTASLEEAIHTPSEDGPDILPAGEFNSRLLAALAQDGLGAIFQELKKKYEFVVVDSSPILPVTDSLMVAQHVDAVILSIRRDVSRRPKVIATRDKLAMLGVPVLGAVVIGLDGDSYGYRGGYYGYGYGYGSRYGYGYQYNRSTDTIKSS